MKKLLWSFVIGMLLGLFSCGNQEIAGTGAKHEYPVSVQIFAKTQAASTYRITVTGPGMTQIGPNEYAGGQTIELYIPKGLDRRIYLERYNAEGKLTDTGSVVTEIGSGINEISQNRITISLKAATGTHRVEFNSRGGSTVASQTLDSGSVATEPVAPTRSGYKFGGWYHDTAFVNVWSFDSDTVVQDTILYAKWTLNPPNSLVVTFNSRGGSTVASQTLDSGSVATEPAAPTRSGYRFGGWYRDTAFVNAWLFDSDTVVQDTILLAKWTQNPPNTIVVTFNSRGGSTVASQTLDSGSVATEPAPQAKPRSGKDTFKGLRTFFCTVRPFISTSDTLTGLFFSLLSLIHLLGEVN